MSIVDEFKVVTRRRKSNRFFRGVHRLTTAAKEEQIEDPEIDLERVRRGILAAVDFIENSNYKNILFEGLDEALRLIKAPDLPDIVCYGLGNFSQSRASKFQLAAVLTIKSHYRSDVYAYDPLFFKSEHEILEELGIRTIDANEEAKRTIEDRTSLVYMPHCPYQLTNNFIYANWNPKNLSNCLVLSNSFEQLVDSIFSKGIQRSTNYINRINPYTTEIELKNNFEYEEVFNGSSLHIFRQEDIEKVPTEFWDNREVPVYKVENCEFLIRSLVREIRFITSDKKVANDNEMVRYIMEQARAHKDTSEVLCKAREELVHLARTYNSYLVSQRLRNQIRSEYAGGGERTVRETADLVGFKLPHDPK